MRMTLVTAHWLTTTTMSMSMLVLPMMAVFYFGLSSSSVVVVGFIGSSNSFSNVRHDTGIRSSCHSTDDAYMRLDHQATSRPTKQWRIARLTETRARRSERRFCWQNLQFFVLELFIQFPCFIMKPSQSMRSSPHPFNQWHSTALLMVRKIETEVCFVWFKISFCVGHYFGSRRRPSDHHTPIIVC